MIRSAEEKHLYKTAIGGTMEKLPYPTEIHHDDIFEDEEVYTIPEECKEEVLKKLWLFDNIPSIDETRYDIHERRSFQLKDFQVIRYEEVNMIVSPYYFSKGGTILDFLRNVDDGISIEVINKK